MGDNYELFTTKDEALAFARGYETAINLIDDDHTFVSEPTQTTDGLWQVDYGYHWK